MEITIGFTENNYAYGNMVIGSRVVPHPEDVQPGHVGEVPIESQ